VVLCTLHLKSCLAAGLIGQPNCGLRYWGDAIIVLWCKFDTVFQVQLGVGITFSWCEVNDEIILDSVNSIGCEIWVVLGEDLSCYWLVVFVGNLGSELAIQKCQGCLVFAYHKMNMSWSHWMTVQKLEQDTSWSICGQRVGSWLQTIEVIFSVGVCSEFSSQVVIALVLWVLEIIFAVC
jgi:hypothetical protein